MLARSTCFPALAYSVRTSAPFGVGQRGQALQDDQPRLDLVAVRGHRRSLAVVGQQADGVVETALRLGALGEVEEHRRVLEQAGLHLLHLRAEPRCRRGR